MTLKSQPSLFKNIPEFNSLLRYKVCPLVTTTLLSEHHRDFDDSTMSVNDFGLFLKLMSLSSTVLLVYGGPDLAGECHILLTTLLHFVNASTQTYSTTPTSHISPYHFTDDENRSYERHLKENGFDDKDFAASMHAQHAQHGDNGDEVSEKLVMLPEVVFNLLTSTMFTLTPLVLAPFVLAEPAICVPSTAPTRRDRLEDGSEPRNPLQRLHG